MDNQPEVARLIITAADQSVCVVEIGERLTIGRSGSNGLVLDDQKASRNHAEIRHLGNRRYRLDDVGSANGTWLNARRITIPKDLCDGDQIQIGAVRMKFVAPVDPQLSLSKTGTSGTALDIRNEFVIVLVSDVRNYTTMSESLPNLQFSEVMSRWFKECTRIVETNGGTIDKFIGDAVMAYWVIASKSKPSTEVDAALNSAVALVQAAADFSIGFSTRFPGYSFGIGIGLNMGPAMLCNVGSAEHQSFTVVGDTVNVAFRLEPLTKSYRCPLIVSSEIAESTSLSCEFQKLGATEVKGRRQPVTILGLQPPAQPANQNTS